MTDEAAALALLAFLEDAGDAPEVLWAAGLAMIRHALDEAGEGMPRFRVYPRGQLRHVRRDVATGLKLARLAVVLQEAETERDRELVADLHEAAAAAGKAKRRAQTLPAELARLEKQRRRRDGLPTENFHLRPDYPARGTG